MVEEKVFDEESVEGSVHRRDAILCVSRMQFKADNRVVCSCTQKHFGQRRKVLRLYNHIYFGIPFLFRTIAPWFSNSDIPPHKHQQLMTSDQ
jgi:hypothetical protein